MWPHEIVMGWQRRPRQIEHSSIPFSNRGWYSNASAAAERAPEVSGDAAGPPPPEASLSAGVASMRNRCRSCVPVDLPDENQKNKFVQAFLIMLLTVLLYSYIIATLCSVLALAFPFLF